MTADYRLDGLFGIILYLAAYTVGIAVHEGGHPLAAQILGLRPRLFVVGRGPTLLRRKVGRVWVDLRAVPVGGVVMLPDWVGRRSARLAFFAAGPAANLLLIGLCTLAAADESSLVAEPAVAAGIAQAALLVIALWPAQAPVQGRQFATDGLQLVRLLAGPAPDRLGPVQAALLKPLLAPGTPPPPPSQHLPEIAFQVARPDRFREAWATRDAQDDMHALLGQPDLPPEERTFVLTFLVGNELCFGGTGTEPGDLDAWSAEALARMPTPHTLVLRGGVLVALGRAEQARDLLRPALAEPLVDADPVLARAFLGVAEAELGGPDEARRLFGEARALAAASAGVLPQVLDRFERVAITRAPAGAARSGVPRDRL